MPVLVCSDDLDAAMNMAVDEVLWDDSSSNALVMRIYSWPDRPVLSLGYFQDSHQVRSQPLLSALPYVRRLTGGGAIVHDREITYSLTLPIASAPRTNDLYAAVHGAVAKELSGMDVPAFVADEADFRSADHHLCFARSDRYAVRVNGTKVMGSAQRRRLDRVLMHGSLIVGRSPAAPEVLGLLDLLPSMPERRLLEDALVTAVEHALHLRFDPNDLPQEVQERAAELAKNKYRTAEWNDRIPGSKAR